MDKPMDDTVRRGEVLTLVQRSVRRRGYGLRRGDQDLGRLRFAPGRRSLATADTDQTGPLVLTTARGGVEVHHRDGGTAVATVEGGRRGTMVIRTAQGRRTTGAGAAAGRGDGRSGSAKPTCSASPPPRGSSRRGSRSPSRWTSPNPPRCC